MVTVLIANVTLGVRTAILPTPTNLRRLCMNIAGMVLGIIAVILVWIPFVGLISIPMVLVGLPLSFFGLQKSRKSGDGVGIAVAGLTTNLIALGAISSLDPVC